MSPKINSYKDTTRRPKNPFRNWVTRTREVRMKSDTKLISVNVGSPRVVMSNGDPVSTGISKSQWPAV